MGTWVHPLDSSAWTVLSCMGLVWMLLCVAAWYALVDTWMKTRWVRLWRRWARRTRRDDPFPNWDEWRM